MIIQSLIHLVSLATVILIVYYTFIFKESGDLYRKKNETRTKKLIEDINKNDKVLDKRTKKSETELVDLQKSQLKMIETQEKEQEKVAEIEKKISTFDELTDENGNIVFGETIAVTESIKLGDNVLKTLNDKLQICNSEGQECKDV